MKLEVKDVVKSFSGNEVLHGISLSVESGRALGLLGRNGAGKTTTIRILMNLFDADRGEILIDGKKFIAQDHQIGYLPEERGLYPKKGVMEQLVYLGQLRKLNKGDVKKNALYWLNRLGVEEYKDKKLETLSKGNQQKVQLAQTFLCNPDIIILDEPFSGLDPLNSQILKDIITELIQDKKLLIFSSHQMSYVEEFCEEIVIMNYGEIVLDGNLKEIKSTFGRNRLTLSIIDRSPMELFEIFKQQLGDIAIVESSRKKDVIIELLPHKTKNDLLKAVIELNLDIDKFSVYEPSLEDIFVKKVGEDN